MAITTESLEIAQLRLRIITLEMTKQLLEERITELEEQQEPNGYSDDGMPLHLSLS